MSEPRSKDSRQGSPQPTPPIGRHTPGRKWHIFAQDRYLGTVHGARLRDIANAIRKARPQAILRVSRLSRTVGVR